MYSLQEQINPGSPARSSVANHNTDHGYDALASYHRQIYGPAGGLAYHPAYPFELVLEHDELILRSIALVFPSGHFVNYKPSRDHGPALKCPIVGLDAEAPPYIYLVYRGRQAWLSESAFGKTERKDIRVPDLELVHSQTLLDPLDFPHTFLVGKLQYVNDNFELLESYMPALLSLGGHPLGNQVLQQTRDNWTKLETANCIICRDLRHVPRDSVFTDLAALAVQLNSLILASRSQVQSFDEQVGFQAVMHVWSNIATALHNYLTKEKLACRPGDALDILQGHTQAYGAFYFSPKDFLAEIECMSNWQDHTEDMSEAVALLNRFFNKVLFAYLELGNGKPILAPGQVLPAREVLGG